jgi:hypothetical protein
MMLNHECPICKKIYERDCTPEPDLPCPECVAELKSAFSYFIGRKEVTYEEYKQFKERYEKNTAIKKFFD